MSEQETKTEEKLKKGQASPEQPNANQGPIPEAAYDANYGDLPLLGDEGGVPGNYPHPMPDPADKKAQEEEDDKTKSKN